MGLNNSFRLSARSLYRLEGVHPDLVACVKRAIKLTNIDFMVVEGVRTLARQKELFNQRPKVTNTMQSMHLIQRDGFGHAVDLAPLENGAIPWNDFSKFRLVAKAMQQAAAELDIKITWGGNWPTLRDGPHYQIEVK